MTRQACGSIEEIRARHGCLPTTTTPYETVLLVDAPPSQQPIGECLSQNFPTREKHEWLEIYVRPNGRDYFEPLVQEHFSLHGHLAIVGRYRHPTDEPRVVGIMLAKDEADIIPLVVANLSKAIDRLYYFAEDAPTRAAIEECSPAGWARFVDLPEGHRDGQRHYLLEVARADKERDQDMRPMWVLPVQGDEIYEDLLRHHVVLAHQEHATAMTCQVATFVLHESQREGWDWELPLEKRFTHYIWDFGEHCGFLDFPWIYYTPSEHMRAHPHGIYPPVWARARPVRKHYPFRSPGQAKARIEDRLKSGWQPHYENYKHPTLDSPWAKRHSDQWDVFLPDGEAAGRKINHYHGWFGEAERVDGIW